MSHAVALPPEPGVGDSSPLTIGDSAARLDALMEQAFEERLDFDPSFGHTVGDLRHRDRITLDLDTGFRRQVVAFLDRHLTSLATIDIQHLDADRQVFHGAFEHWLKSLRRAMEQPDQLTPLLPGFGVPTTFAQLAAGQGDLDLSRPARGPRSCARCHRGARVEADLRSPA